MILFTKKYRDEMESDTSIHLDSGFIKPLCTLKKGRQLGERGGE